MGNTVPSGISFELSDDERMMIDSVRDYCQTEIAAFVKAHGAENYIPTEKMRELLKGLTEFGFVGGPIAQEHGGLGLSWKTFGLLLEELCAVSLSIGITAFIQTMVATLCEKLLAPELRDKYLPQILSCDAIACMGISEPDVGSNVVEIKCKAKPVEGGYVLSGEKTWISNGDYADICICVARTGDAPTALDLFLVDRRESPFDSKNIHKMALNATSTAQLFFADCKVPEQHRLTQNGQGLRQVGGIFGVSRPLVGVFSVGLGRAALEAAVSYAQERKQHGKAHRRPPTDLRLPGRDGHQDRCLAPTHPARPRPARSRCALRVRIGHGQVVRHRAGRRDHQSGAADPRRQRRDLRVPGGTPVPRGARVPHPGRHHRNQQADHRSRSDRHFGLLTRSTEHGHESQFRTNLPPPCRAAWRRAGADQLRARAQLQFSRAPPADQPHRQRAA
jgi:alkylation response protein AidB-like acyl-CoA dehydrogenase